MSGIRSMPFIIIVLSLILYSPLGKTESLGSFGGAIFQYQEKMAVKGDFLAQYKLGTLYEFGISVQPDIEKARHWYQLAAKRDYQPAINRYTYLDIKANGFDEQKHNQWLAALRQQAEKSEPNALILLGQMNHHGIGVSVNLDKALELLSRASALGSTEIDSEIDRISLEIDRQNQAIQQQKLDEEIRSKKQKADEMAEKRRRYDEAINKIREEKKALDDQQAWVESQRKIKK